MRLAALCWGLVFALPAVVWAQNAFSPGGPDYAIAGALMGDQTFPQAAISPGGGWLVWQDNAVDNDGFGIKAQVLNSSLAKSGAAFRVNAQGAGDQEKPQVSLLNGGGAVFVWQGGMPGFQKIYARFMAANGTFLTGDLLVNTYTNEFQVNPSVAALADGSVVVVWGSYGQDGDRQGVFAQRFSSAGAKLGGEFQVNQYTPNNQRTPTVAALTNGNFVVTWVSELQRAAASVDVYARIFTISNSLPVAVGSEFPVNTSVTNLCANPQVAGSTAGGFAVVWSQNADVTSATGSPSETGTPNIPAGILTSDGWDVFGRVFNASGAAVSAPVRLNTWTYGDQFAPKISAFGKNYLTVWISLGEDGDWEGIFGQFLTSNGGLAGLEFRVNTTTVSRQIDPSVCADGINRFLVCWSSFEAGTSFDLFARAYDLIRVDVAVSAQGVTISWNTQPGSVYQVQSSANYFSGNSTWSNVGSPRTAVGLADSVVLSPSGGGAFYRVVRTQ